MYEVENFTKAELEAREYRRQQPDYLMWIISLVVLAMILIGWTSENNASNDPNPSGESYCDVHHC